jgi:hypothetical protein
LTHGLKAILAGVSSSLPDRAIADKKISIAYAPWEKGDAQIFNLCEKTECFFHKNFKNLEGFRTKLFIDLIMKFNSLEIFLVFGKREKLWLSRQIYVYVWEYLRRERFSLLGKS